jgi:hypothetical protein
MRNEKTRHWCSKALVGLLAGLLASAAAADEGPRRTAAQPTRIASARRLPAGKDHAAVHSMVRPAVYYRRTWGIDIVGVRPVASGLMLRFDYRVVDPTLAAVLTDRQSKPYLIDQASRTALAVPAMENVGELRQIAPLEAGRTYFMIFGNPGRVVKRGSRVTIMVGNFRAEELVVQ